MTAPDIVICEFMDEAAVESLSRVQSTLYDPTLVDDPARLAQALAGARALIVRNRTQVRGALLEAAADLTVVGRLGVGLDNIDLEACATRGIEVIPATGANAAAVAEYVIAATLLLVRGAFDRRAAMIAGAWPRNSLIGGEIAGRTLGLVGYGGIAREVAARATALGMRVIAHDPHLPEDDSVWGTTEPVALDDLCARADVVSLHIPLTEATRHLFDEARLATMNAGAILINTARGGVVDDAALAEALRRGHLGGAALDVFETEPLTAEAGALFEGLENVILTPHIAGVTGESNVRVSALIAEKVAVALVG
ncbi:hydroxyacid dehydrogenase [Stappia sp.]|uniref:hydroxyacid dehydrogenase n=1 Tax=Stappia sp. TaxID=1870903 RepID=UPI0032D93E5B